MLTHIVQRLNFISHSAFFPLAGLYFGLYTCVGTHTCKGNRPGSYGNFERDAATFKEWGMDFIKADNCHK